MCVFFSAAVFQQDGQQLVVEPQQSQETWRR